DAMPLVCNLKFFESLPAEYQAVVQAGAIYAQEVSRFINHEREDLILADLDAQGMKINTVSDEVRAEMAAAAQPAAIELISKDIGQDAIDQYLANVQDVLAQIAKY
ncbi:MAG: TRAP transporter substrate-binding protein, partial [Clostridia bacterium]|nr:TRAP transporter substrate-binding protein [Clostridia bacterium]